MALNPTWSAAAKNAALDSALSGLDAGFMDIYDGAQPASPDTAVTSQNKLVRLTLNSTAFAAATGGSKTANAVGSAAAIATGTAAWYRLVKSGGTAVHDGSVGVATANAIVPTVSFVLAVTISCSSLVVSVP